MLCTVRGLQQEQPLEENHNTTITITSQEQALRKKEKSGKESR